MIKKILGLARTTQHARTKASWAAWITALDQRWMDRYRELTAFHERHGHANVPKYHRNHQLANWVKCQRERRRGTPKQKPPKAWQVKLLDKIGFVWDGTELKWRNNYQDLCQFKQDTGHCDIHNADNPRLARWLAIQRQLHMQGTIKPTHKTLLNRIGFNWEGERSERNRQRAWLRMHNRLKQYKIRFGNTNVPRNWSDQKLAIWVAAQRQSYQKKELSKQRIALLNAIGFTWRLVVRGRWEDHFADAVAFKAKHGHCRIRGTKHNNARLERWARRMQSRYNCGQLSPSRVKKLNSIGFDWSSNRVFEYRELWNQQYQKLIAYQQKFDHCRVPLEWPKDKPLSRWVAKQRANYRQGTIEADRKRLLNKIKFEWQP